MSMLLPRLPRLSAHQNAIGHSVVVDYKQSIHSPGSYYEIPKRLQKHRPQVAEPHLDDGDDKRVHVLDCVERAVADIIGGCC